MQVAVREACERRDSRDTERERISDLAARDVLLAAEAAAGLAGEPGNGDQPIRVVALNDRAGGQIGVPPVRHVAAVADEAIRVDAGVVPGSVARIVDCGVAVAECAADTPRLGYRAIDTE